jgi:hypothetical protein
LEELLDGPRGESPRWCYHWEWGEVVSTDNFVSVGNAEDFLCCKAQQTVWELGVPKDLQGGRRRG